MTAEEKLMAFVDGELDREDDAVFRAALAQDPRLQDELVRERLLRRKLAQIHHDVLEEQVPSRLLETITADQSTVTPFRRVAPRQSSFFGPGGWWKNVTAIAASLVLGLFLGQTFTGSSDGDRDGLPGMNQQLAMALDTQLASSQTPDDPVQIGTTFIAATGEPCRTYETASVAGLACRSQGEWQLKLVAPGVARSTSGYQQAGSSSEVVLRNAQDMLRDGPFDAEQERQARDAGWPDGAP